MVKLGVLAVLSLATSATAFVMPTTNTARKACTAVSMSGADEQGVSRRDLVKTTAGLAAAVSAVAPLVGMPKIAEAKSPAWVQVKNVPQGATFYDIDFDPSNPDHGYIVGAKGTFLETNDGGDTWNPRSFLDLDEEEEINYRFEKVSFTNNEGWIIGKPPILLHTADGGKSWERIPLSTKLPGEPSTVFATGPSTAEMTTSTGAIYKTTNAGRNWKAQVKETIDATLNRISSSGVQGASYFTGSIINVVRDQEEGAYIAVSSRGNFYLTWRPGQEFWTPHNRGSARRIQNMGFQQGKFEKGVWVTLNGGILQLTKEKPGFEDDKYPFEDVKLRSGGYGLIDVAWKDDKEVWAVGGGGVMYVSKDGGQSFAFNGAADDIPGNLYRVKFFGNRGFVLGSEGVLLKYNGLSA